MTTSSLKPGCALTDGDVMLSLDGDGERGGDVWCEVGEAWLVPTAVRMAVGGVWPALCPPGGVNVLDVMDGRFLEPRTKTERRPGKYLGEFLS